MRLEPAAQGLAAAFPALLLQASRVAASLMQGMHGRRRAGAGEDFWQFRPYAAGDSTARIDWRKSARAGSAFIREREWAAPNTLWIWAEGGPGMAWKSKLASTTKRERACLLTLTLAILAADAGERVGLLGAEAPPGHSRATLSAIAAALEQEKAASLPPLTALPRHSTLLLAGDFLTPLDELAQRFSALAERAGRAHLIEIADPAEETLPWSGRVEFQAPQGDARITFGRTQDMRERYVEARLRHRAGLRDLARRLGWTVSLHRTDEAPARLLLGLHPQLSQRPGS